MCALRQYDFILIFVWVTSREHSRMVLIQVLPQCNGISLNYTAMDKHTRGFMCGSKDVSLPSYELMKSFKINWQDGVHLWSTVGLYISSVFTGANTYLKYQNNNIHFFAVDMINQSDRGYNVDQSPVCLKHNQSLFIKLKSCCHLEIKDTNWWVDQMQGRKLDFKCILNLTGGKSAQTSQTHIPQSQSSIISIVTSLSVCVCYDCMYVKVDLGCVTCVSNVVLSLYKSYT